MVGKVKKGAKKGAPKVKAAAAAAADDEENKENQQQQQQQQQTSHQEKKTGGLQQQQQSGATVDATPAAVTAKGPIALSTVPLLPVMSLPQSSLAGNIRVSSAAAAAAPKAADSAGESEAEEEAAAAAASHSSTTKPIEKKKEEPAKEELSTEDQQKLNQLTADLSKELLGALKDPDGWVAFNQGVKVTDSALFISLWAVSEFIDEHNDKVFVEPTALGLNALWLIKRAILQHLVHVIHKKLDDVDETKLDIASQMSELISEANCAFLFEHASFDTVLVQAVSLSSADGLQTGAVNYLLHWNKEFVKIIDSASVWLDALRAKGDQADDGSPENDSSIAQHTVRVDRHMEAAAKIVKDTAKVLSHWFDTQQKIDAAESAVDHAAHQLQAKLAKLQEQLKDIEKQLVEQRAFVAGLDKQLGELKPTGSIEQRGKRIASFKKNLAMCEESIAEFKDDPEAQGPYNLQLELFQKQLKEAEEALTEHRAIEKDIQTVTAGIERLRAEKTKVDKLIDEAMQNAPDHVSPMRPQPTAEEHYVDMTDFDDDGDVNMTDLDPAEAFDRCLGSNGSIDMARLDQCHWDSIQPHLAAHIAPFFKMSPDDAKKLSREALGPLVTVFNLSRVGQAAAQPSMSSTPHSGGSSGAGSAAAASSGSGSAAGSTAADQPPMIEIVKMNKDEIKAVATKYEGKTVSSSVERLMGGLSAASLSYEKSWKKKGDTASEARREFHRQCKAALAASDQQLTDGMITDAPEVDAASLKDNKSVHSLATTHCGRHLNANNFSSPGARRIRQRLRQILHSPAREAAIAKQAKGRALSDEQKKQEGFISMPAPPEDSQDPHCDAIFMTPTHISGEMFVYTWRQAEQAARATINPIVFAAHLIRWHQTAGKKSGPGEAPQSPPPEGESDPDPPGTDRKGGPPSAGGSGGSKRRASDSSSYASGSPSKKLKQSDAKSATDRDFDGVSSDESKSSPSSPAGPRDRDLPPREAAAKAAALIQQQTAVAAITGSDGSGHTPPAEKFSSIVEAGFEFVKDLPEYKRLACLAHSPVFRREAEKSLALNIDKNAEIKQEWKEVDEGDLSTVKELLILRLRLQAEEELAQLKDDDAVKKNMDKLTDGFDTTKIKTPIKHIDFSTRVTGPPGETVMARWAPSPSATETNVAGCFLKGEGKKVLLFRAAVLSTSHHPVYASPGTGLTKLKLPNDKKPALWLEKDNVIVGIGPVFTCLSNPAARASHFEELLNKVGDKQFPWPQPVPDEFVCTPMLLNLDPLDPEASRGHVKPVGQAYLDFLKRTDWFDNGRKKGELPPFFICTMNAKQLDVVGQKLNGSLVQQWQTTLSAPVQL